MSATRYLNEFGRHLGAAKTSTPFQRSLSQLQKALLAYATVSSRLFFIQDPNIYLDFRHNNDAVSDYSAAELSEIMLKTILPNLNLYNVSSRIKNRLKYLEFHPCFEKTQHGYQYSPSRLGAPYILQPNTDFSLAEQLPTLLSAHQRRPFRSIHRKDVLTRTEEISQTVLLSGRDAGLKRQLSPDIAAFLSVIVSNNLELSVNQMHNVSQVKMRLQSIKQNFQATGNLLDYSENLDNVLKTIELFEALKKHLIRCFRSL